MDIDEWYQINKKRISVLNIPEVYNRKDVLNKVVSVSFQMYTEMNESIEDVELLPSLNLTDDELKKWYDYIIQSAKDNILMQLEGERKEKQEGKRRSLLGGCK